MIGWGELIRDVTVDVVLLRIVYLLGMRATCECLCCEITNCML
jgi:hypothetical protein